MCLALLCSCLGPGSCNLCACGGRELKSSILTRLLYFSFLLAVLVVCAIMLSPTVSETLLNTEILCVPLLERHPDTQVVIPDFLNNNTLPCEQFIGFLAVYRVCGGVASFFLLLTLLMVLVRNKNDPRSYLQNGFWVFKWLIVIGLVAGFFHIPDGKDLIFSKGIGMTASGIFILLQLIVLVDFAYSWAESWIDKAEKKSNRWYFFMLGFTLVFLVGSVIGTIFLYIFFTEKSTCTLNKIFISINLALGAGVVVLSVLPFIQKAQPKSGLLQASVVTAYCTYLIWSGVSAEPYGTDRVVGGLHDCRVRNASLYIFGHDKNSVAASVIGVAMLFFTVTYTCFTLSTTRQLNKIKGIAKEVAKEEEDTDAAPTSIKSSVLDSLCTKARNDDDDYDEDDISKLSKLHANDEREELPYSYSFFHFLIFLAVLYFMMNLTNWAQPAFANTDFFQRTVASTWVRVVSSWLCYIIYMWTLLAPLVLGKCRDFV